MKKQKMMFLRHVAARLLAGVLLIAMCAVFCAADTNLVLGEGALQISAPKAFNTFLSVKEESDVLGIRLILPQVIRDLVGMDSDTLAQNYGFTSAKVQLQTDLSLEDSVHYQYQDGGEGYVPLATVDITNPNAIYDNDAVVLFTDGAVAKYLGDAVVSKTSQGKTTANFAKEKVTLFARSRFAVTTTDAAGNIQHLTSDWSDSFSVGKNGKLYSDVSTLSVPTVSDAKIIGDDPNADRALSLTLTLPADADQATMYRYINHLHYMKGMVSLRVNGKQSVYELNDDNTPLCEGIFSLSLGVGTVPANALVSMQGYLSADADYIRSDYSPLLSLKIQPADAPEVNADGDVITKVESEDTQNAPVREKCRICGICPAPFGICLFLAGGILIILILALLAFVAVRKNMQKKECPRCHTKCDPKEKVCPSCGYRYSTILPLVEDEEKEAAIDEEEVRQIEKAEAADEMEDDEMQAAEPMPENKENSGE